MTNIAMHFKIKELQTENKKLKVLNNLYNRINQLMLFQASPLYVAYERGITIKNYIYDITMIQIAIALKDPKIYTKRGKKEMQPILKDLCWYYESASTPQEYVYKRCKKKTSKKKKIII